MQTISEPAATDCTDTRLAFMPRHQPELSIHWIPVYGRGPEHALWANAPYAPSHPAEPERLVAVWLDADVPVVH